jgi:hypothetical protein
MSGMREVESRDWGFGVRRRRFVREAGCAGMAEEEEAGTAGGEGDEEG